MILDVTHQDFYRVIYCSERVRCFSKLRGWPGHTAGDAWWRVWGQDRPAGEQAPLLLKTPDCDRVLKAQRLCQRGQSAH